MTRFWDPSTFFFFFLFRLRRRARGPGGRRFSQYTRGAQADRVGTFSANARLPSGTLTRRTKTDIIANCILSVAEVQPPRRRNIFFEKKSLKTSKFGCQIAAIRSVLPINQRVNSPIGTAEKIERDSKSKRREKGFDRSVTVRSNCS